MNRLSAFLCSPLFPLLVVSEEAKTGDTVLRYHLQQLENTHRFRGSVLLAKDGEITAEASAGTIDGTPSGIPIDSETLFEIASATKSFTATAVLLLAESGELALDDPIRKWLPEVPANCDAITIRQLLSHSSGIPGTNTRGSGNDFSQVALTFFAGGPKSEPGSRYEYWNQGYGALSEVIARASGIRYTEYLRDRIFRPLDMTSTCFTGDEAPEGTTAVLGISSRGDRTALEHPYGAYGFQYRGMGGIVSTPRDLFRFLTAVNSGALLKNESREEMWRFEKRRYGLGWKFRNIGEDFTSIGHSGSVRGFSSMMAIYPETNGIIIVLGASEVYSTFGPVRAAAEALIRGKSPIVKKSRPGPSPFLNLTGEVPMSPSPGSRVARGFSFENISNEFSLDGHGEASSFLPEASSTE